MFVSATHKKFLPDLHPQFWPLLLINLLENKIHNNPECKTIIISQCYTHCIHVHVSYINTYSGVLTDTLYMYNQILYPSQVNSLKLHLDILNNICEHFYLYSLHEYLISLFFVYINTFQQYAIFMNAWEYEHVCIFSCIVHLQYLYFQRFQLPLIGPKAASLASALRSLPE